MDREIRLGLDDWSITEALFTWNGENNTKSVGHKMKKIKKNKKNATIPKETVGIRYCGIFYQEITSDLRVKNKYFSVEKQTLIQSKSACPNVLNE